MTLKEEPRITVGIIDGRAKISGRFDGPYRMDDGRIVPPQLFAAEAAEGSVRVTDATGRELARKPSIRLKAEPDSTFHLFGVTIGKRFHWERPQDQAFRGNLLLVTRNDGTTLAINEIGLEDYLKSVISSEMNPHAPFEFLKAHAVLSRSWLLAMLGRREREKNRQANSANNGAERDEIVRWYGTEDHDLFDVCSDDHCQRYHGITRIVSGTAERAVNDTRGLVVTFQGEICDARYSKACGGLTEEFATAWEDRAIPYLKTVSDARSCYQPVKNEEDAARWITSSPAAYCNTDDRALLATILPDFDTETKGFFRWTIEYRADELADILLAKSGLDFGTLRGFIPLRRGPSGRITRLRIVGSKMSYVVGKELEIRRWLSRSHLYSSAFVIEAKSGRAGGIRSFAFHGAGWGHGVGLCQIGAAVMASRGFSAEEILRHYFTGVDVEKGY